IDWIHMAANGLVREDQRDPLAVHRESRRHLRSNEPAPDNCEAVTVLRQAPHPLVIVERAVVDDLIAANAEPARGTPGGQEQLAEAVDRALIVRHLLLLCIQRLRGARMVERHHTAVDLAPDAAERFACPEPLGQWWAVVRRMRLGGDHPDRAGVIYLANASDGRGGRHSAANDQIGIVRHVRSRDEGNDISSEVVRTAAYALRPGFVSCGTGAWPSHCCISEASFERRSVSWRRDASGAAITSVGIRKPAASPAPSREWSRPRSSSRVTRGTRAVVRCQHPSRENECGDT